MVVLSSAKEGELKRIRTRTEVTFPPSTVLCHDPRRIDLEVHSERRIPGEPLGNSNTKYAQNAEADYML